jgi:hypothetical protein
MGGVLFRKKVAAQLRMTGGRDTKNGKWGKEDTGIGMSPPLFLTCTFIVTIC